MHLGWQPGVRSGGTSLPHLPLEGRVGCELPLAGRITLCTSGGNLGCAGGDAFPPHMSPEVRVGCELPSAGRTTLCTSGGNLGCAGGDDLPCYQGCVSGGLSSPSATLGAWGGGGDSPCHQGCAGGMNPLCCLQWHRGAQSLLTFWGGLGSPLVVGQEAGAFFGATRLRVSLHLSGGACCTRALAHDLAPLVRAWVRLGPAATVSSYPSLFAGLVLLR